LQLAKATKIQKPLVRNIVATINLDRTIDFEYLLKILNGCEYNPEKFPAVIYRHNNGTCLIFKSGKIIVSGAKTEEYITALANEFKKILS